MPERSYEDLYRILVREMEEYGIFLMETDGAITTWNAGVETILGYPEQLFVGENVSMIFTPEDQAAGQPEAERTTAALQGFSPDERWHVRMDGKLIFVDGVVRPLRDNHGALIGFSKIMRDATRRKLAENERDRLIHEQRAGREQLQAAHDILKRSNEDLQDFAHVISHDLQAPIRAMKSYSQLLTQRYKDKLDPNAQEFLGFIVEGADRMTNLITGLLKYAQATNLDATPLKLVSADAVMRGALVNLQTAIDESGATVTQDPLPMVLADPLQLMQLFQNLIGNALKYRGSEPSRVHVSASEREEEWVFSLRDNGVGIDPKYSTRIFGLFKRLHDTTQPGSGIGLAICKKIVERNGGRIWVESEAGKGATFYFSILK
ncbi:MAG TPA: ATP-binding protein [Bryobacteraceae bacterium]|nr:ATP-binding protein [Bryobacteraceae bacterium]